MFQLVRTKSLNENMESFEGVSRGPPKGQSVNEEDYDYCYRKRREDDDEDGDEENECVDDLNDDEFCSDFLKPRVNKITGGINLKDLCEGKEILFQMSDKPEKTDEERYYEKEDSDDEDEEVKRKNEEILNNFQREQLKLYENYEPTFFLKENFESLAKQMTSIADDDGVKKQVIVEGIGDVVPENSFIIVHYNLFKQTSEKPFDSTYLRHRPERINLGQNELIPGLETAMKTMRKKEISRFFIHWKHAFGAMGCPVRIEPKCNIIADITLVNFREIDIPVLMSDCTSWFERVIAQVKIEQAFGNESFADGKIKRAAMRYKNAVKLINNLGFPTARDERTALDLKVDCLVNLAICYQKMGKHELSSVMCHEALSISPKNKKVMFHYAKASIALSNFTKAQNLLMRLNKLSPNNPEVFHEFVKLEQKKQLYRVLTRDFWLKAFGADMPPGAEKKEANAEEGNAEGAAEGNAERNAEGSESPDRSSKAEEKAEGKAEEKAEGKAEGKAEEKDEEEDDEEDRKRKVEELSRRLKQSVKLSDEEDECWN